MTSLNRASPLQQRMHFDRVARLARLQGKPAPPEPKFQWSTPAEPEPEPLPLPEPASACPCCGEPLKHFIELRGLLSAGFTPQQQRVLDALVISYPQAHSLRKLADIIYGDDPTGGPDRAENVISVMVGRMRQRLASMGWRVGPGVARNGLRLWRIEGDD